MTVSTPVGRRGSEFDRLQAQVEFGPETRTTARHAYELLRQAILTGALAPGEPLLVKELTEATGLSRMPIREALAQLARAGLVEIEPRRSARVSELSSADLKDVYDARLLLELPVIADVASNFEETDHATAQRWLERIRTALDAGEVSAAVRAHSCFHLTLLRAGSTRRLVRLLSPLWDSSDRYLFASVGHSGILAATKMKEHERLLAACRSRNAELAEAELWNHLIGTANRTSAGMGGPELYELRPVPVLS